jgi:predicted dehydrogenase
MSIGFGFIGLGFMAATHIRALAKAPGTHVAAICNPSGRNLDGDLTRVGGNVGDPDGVRLDMARVRAYRDPAAVLADPEVRVVDITTPTRTHLDLALAALAAGKHVVLEKPMTRTAAEGRRLVAAAREAAARGVHLMPAMCLRFWPEWTEAKRAVEDGRHGRVLSARFRRVAQAPGWGHGHFLNGADSGGALLDLHVHDVDFIRYLFGHPTRVFARGHTAVSGGIDHVVAQYDVPGGAVVGAEGSWAMTPGFGFVMAYTVVFERATLDYDLARGAEALRLFVAGKPPEVLRPEGPDGYAGQLRHFVECVAEGRAPWVVTAEDGAAAVAVCEAEAESIRTGLPVALS